MSEYVVPAGWKLVPIEPTQRMLDAGKGALYRHLANEAPQHLGNMGYRVTKTHKFKIRWAAMVNAAPEPQ